MGRYPCVQAGQSVAAEDPLTRNEIAYLLAAIAIGPRTTPGTASAGLGGDAATGVGPAPATTGGKPAKTPNAARTSFSI